MGIKLDIDKIVNGETQRPRLRPRRSIKLQPRSTGGAARKGCCGRGLSGGKTLVPKK